MVEVRGGGCRRRRLSAGAYGLPGSCKARAVGCMWTRGAWEASPVTCLAYVIVMEGIGTSGPAPHHAKPPAGIWLDEVPRWEEVEAC